MSEMSSDFLVAAGDLVDALGDAGAFVSAGGDASSVSVISVEEMQGLSREQRGSNYKKECKLVLMPGAGAVEGMLGGRLTFRGQEYSIVQARVAPSGMWALMGEVIERKVVRGG